MTHHWTHDPDVDAVDIDLAGTEITYPIKCIDLHGAHVILDVDAIGRIVSIEILGPVRNDLDGCLMPLSDLNMAKYLLREAND